MYKITRTVIDLSSIPAEYRKHPLLKGATRQTYSEFHYSKNEPDDDFTNYLIETYPSLKRIHAFLIYIDI
jgi:hypothetical protein